MTIDINKLAKRYCNDVCRNKDIGKNTIIFIDAYNKKELPPGNVHILRDILPDDFRISSKWLVKYINYYHINTLNISLSNFSSEKLISNLGKRSIHDQHADQILDTLNLFNIYYEECTNMKTYYDFLNKLKPHNQSLIEAVEEGYRLLESISHPKVEWVDTDKIYPFREFDRIDNSMYSDEDFEKFKKSIAEEGIKEALILKYHQYSKTALLIEGNHRLRAARELGLDKVPVRVVRYQSEGEGIPVPGYTANDFGYVPGDLSPSEIGIK
jgi:hypothetical protein